MNSELTIKNVGVGVGRDLQSLPFEQLALKSRTFYQSAIAEHATFIAERDTPIAEMLTASLNQTVPHLNDKH